MPGCVQTQGAIHKNEIRNQAYIEANLSIRGKRQHYSICDGKDKRFFHALEPPLQSSLDIIITGNANTLACSPQSSLFLSHVEWAQASSPAMVFQITFHQYAETNRALERLKTSVKETVIGSQAKGRNKDSGSQLLQTAANAFWTHVQKKSIYNILFITKYH